MASNAEKLSALLPLISHAMDHLSAPATATGVRVGLTNTRLTALLALSHDDRMRMADLAALLDLPAPLATRTVDELVERGLATREADSADRRRVLVSLTDLGRSTLAEANAETAQIVSLVLGHMATDDIDALIRGLLAFLDSMHGESGVLEEHDHPREKIAPAFPKER